MNTQRLQGAILATIIKHEHCSGTIIRATIDPFNIITQEINSIIWNMVDRNELVWRADRDFELSVRVRTTA